MTLAGLRAPLLIALLLLSAAERTAAQSQPAEKVAVLPALARATPTANWMLQHDAPPSSGIPQVVVGWAALGIGVLNLALIPVCFADFYPDKGRDICKYGSIGLGAVGLAVGIPFLIMGYNQRARRADWERKRNGFGLLENLHFAAHGGGWALGYRAEF
jgi:hypothetical protein